MSKCIYFIVTTICTLVLLVSKPVAKERNVQFKMGVDYLEVMSIKIGRGSSFFDDLGISEDPSCEEVVGDRLKERYYSMLTDSLMKNWGYELSTSNKEELKKFISSESILAPFVDEIIQEHGNLVNCPRIMNFRTNNDYKKNVGLVKNSSINRRLSEIAGFKPNATEDRPMVTAVVEIFSNSDAVSRLEITRPLDGNSKKEVIAKYLEYWGVNQPTLFNEVECRFSTNNPSITIACRDNNFLFNHSEALLEKLKNAIVNHMKPVKEKEFSL